MLVRLPVPRRIIAYKDTVLAIWQRFDSPIGPLSLAATARGVSRVAFSCEAPPEPTGGSCEFLDAARAWIESYFAGMFLPVDFPLALNDDTFTRRAQWALAGIPAGTTRTYSWLADAAGSPAAIRAAGSACAANPLPLFLPCHRIVRADGAIGNYRGGQDAKLWLLEHERNHSAGKGV